MYCPLVSILIPNYNKALYLKETLDSVLDQTYSNWECIVVDDHSSDQSWEILEEYAKKDSRVKIFKRPENRSKGGSVARNYAFELSEGEFIQWLDSDDVIHPNKVQTQLNDLLSNKLNSVSISNWDWFEFIIDIKNHDRFSDCFTDIDLRLEGYPKEGFELILWLFKNNLFIPSHAYFMCRNTIIASGLWKEDLNKNQDGEFMLRVLLHSKKVVFNKSVYAFYRRPVSSHLSKQRTLQTFIDWFRSYELGDQNILAIKNTKEVREILILNYERLIKFTGLEVPIVTQMALERIKVLKPTVRYDLSKPYLIWLGAWLGLNNFLRFRSVLISLKIIKN
ncbi:glycosyltransferase family 2 protein [Echinicola jeungdonensis]|uniref:Glycosyltransferase family 2 protein n=1 Tax=Echinicola jeungdonensis TaxID=709343 RepID=A0ABV5J4B1_9BACT|nr:glycosyltransferase family 2 protein [Echinicola jeungdonensis]MDN3667874.1 glycosyltransferase family 2 protein [Echinicola jeungdonensis]